MGTYYHNFALLLFYRLRHRHLQRSPIFYFYLYFMSALGQQWDRGYIYKKKLGIFIFFCLDFFYLNEFYNLVIIFISCIIQMKCIEKSDFVF